MTAPLLDTHVWVWWVDGNPRLDRRLIDQLDALDADDPPHLSAISLWEVATLVSLGRLEFETSLDAWLARAADSRTVRILPITAAIAVDLTRLPDTLPRDPADRLIVSTARVHQLPLCTADRAILKSRLAPAWRP